MKSVQRHIEGGFVPVCQDRRKHLKSYSCALKTWMPSGWCQMRRLRTIWWHHHPEAFPQSPKPRTLPLGESAKPKDHERSCRINWSFPDCRRPVKDFLPTKCHSSISSGKPVGGYENKASKYKHCRFHRNTAKFEPRNKALLACHASCQTGNLKAEFPEIQVSNNYMCFVPKFAVGQWSRTDT